MTRSCERCVGRVLPLHRTHPCLTDVAPIRNLHRKARSAAPPSTYAPSICISGILHHVSWDGGSGHVLMMRTHPALVLWTGIYARILVMMPAFTPSSDAHTQHCTAPGCSRPCSTSPLNTHMQPHAHTGVWRVQHYRGPRPADGDCKTRRSRFPCE